MKKLEIKLLRSIEGELFISYRFDDKKNFTLHSMVYMKDIKLIE